MNILNDGLLHFGAGLVLSWADYATYRAVHRKSDRIELKTACLESIDLLLDVEGRSGQPAEGLKSPDKGIETSRPLPSKESMQYALNVDQVKSYFMSEGIIKKNVPVFLKLKYFFKNLVYEERLNNLSVGAKFIFATAAEFLYDSLFGIRYYTQIRKESPLASLANNIYQIPAFFAGLWTGNVLKKGFDWFRSGDEKKLDKAINRLVRGTDIVDLVLTYKPPESLKPELEKQGVRDYTAKLTSAGKITLKKMGKNVTDLAYRMTHFKEISDKKHDERSQEIRERFDEIVAKHEEKSK